MFTGLDVLAAIITGIGGIIGVISQDRKMKKMLADEVEKQLATKDKELGGETIIDVEEES